jgi:hypothetical protein
MNASAIQIVQTAHADNLAFCRTAGARCYGNYSPEVLRDYLAFHLVHGTYFWTRHAGQIVGNLVAWRVNEARLRANDAVHGQPFDWTPDDPDADSLFVGTVIATQPGALVTLIQALTRRFPNLANLKWFTYRHGRLVTLTRPAMRRLIERQR